MMSSPAAFSAYGVPDLEWHHREPDNDLADGRIVVNRHQHLAFHGSHEIGHAPVFRKREVHALALGLPIGQVQIEQRSWPAIELNTVMPGHLLKKDIGQGVSPDEITPSDNRYAPSRSVRIYTERLRIAAMHGGIVQIGSPFLHHLPALSQVLRFVIDTADLILIFICKLAFDGIAKYLASREARPTFSL